MSKLKDYIVTAYVPVATGEKVYRVQAINETEACEAVKLGHGKFISEKFDVEQFGTMKVESVF
jgi:hypothetical protein